MSFTKYFRWTDPDLRPNTQEYSLLVHICKGAYLEAAFMCVVTMLFVWLFGKGWTFLDQAMSVYEFCDNQVFKFAGYFIVGLIIAGWFIHLQWFVENLHKYDQAKVVRHKYISIILAALVLSLLSLVITQVNFLSVLSISIVIFLINWFVFAKFSLIAPAWIRVLAILILGTAISLILYYFGLFTTPLTVNILAVVLVSLGINSEMNTMKRQILKIGAARFNVQYAFNRVSLVIYAYFLTMLVYLYINASNEKESA